MTYAKRPYRTDPTIKSFPDDVPLDDLRQLEENFKAGIEKLVHENLPIFKSLDRAKVDVWPEDLANGMSDFVEDYLASETMRLENQ